MNHEDCHRRQVYTSGGDRLRELLKGLVKELRKAKEKPDVEERRRVNVDTANTADQARLRDFKPPSHETVDTMNLKVRRVGRVDLVVSGETHDVSSRMSAASFTEMGETS